MKKVLSILLTFTFISGFSQWKEVPTPTDESLNKIEIINGIAFCSGNNGVLLKSTNEGETWTEVSTTATGNINTIQFINSTTGFFSTSEGNVFKTTNGGTSWSSSNLHSGGINGLDFMNTSTGLAVGDNGNIFRTTDGGSNWTNLESQSVFVINDVTFLNDTLAVCAGALGSYLYSTNSGETWTYQSVNTTETFSAIEKLNDSTAVIVGTNGSYCEFTESNLKIGAISKIDTEGDWLRDVKVTVKQNSKVRIMAVGYGSSLSLNTYGWIKADLDSINNLNGIHFYNDSTGLVCGFNGKIYKTSTLGVVSIGNKITREYFHIYPNPANNYINLGEKGIGEKLNIYTLDGKLIRRDRLTSSNYEISTLPPGSYIVQITSENSIYTSRFIKK